MQRSYPDTFLYTKLAPKPVSVALWLSGRIPPNKIPQTNKVPLISETFQSTYTSWIKQKYRVLTTIVTFGAITDTFQSTYTSWIKQKYRVLTTIVTFGAITDT